MTLYLLLFSTSSSSLPVSFFVVFFLWVLYWGLFCWAARVLCFRSNLVTPRLWLPISIVWKSTNFQLVSGFSHCYHCQFLQGFLGFSHLSRWICHFHGGLIPFCILVYSRIHFLLFFLFRAGCIFSSILVKCISTFSFFSF